MLRVLRTQGSLTDSHTSDVNYYILASRTPDMKHLPDLWYMIIFSHSHYLMICLICVTVTDATSLNALCPSPCQWKWQWKKSANFCSFNNTGLEAKNNQTVFVLKKYWFVIKYDRDAQCYCSLISHSWNRHHPAPLPPPPPTPTLPEWSIILWLSHVNNMAILRRWFPQRTSKSEYENEI